MLRLKKVAVTGGISCGKTEFCSCLKKLGAYVVSADDLVHQLLSPKTNLGKEIIKLLGPEVLIDDQINRKAIAKKVFDKPHLLQSLERILHPEVFQKINLEYEKANKTSVKLFIAEIPLLFEIKAEKYFDTTVAIIADEKLCIKRFTKGSDEYKRRMSRQLSQEKKAKKAAYVICNNGSYEDLVLVANFFYQSMIN